MANEKSVGGSESKTAGEVARQAAMKAGRAITSAKIAKLSPEEKLALRQVRNAKNVLEVVADRIVDGKAIPVEVLQACAALAGASASVLYD